MISCPDGSLLQQLLSEALRPDERETLELHLSECRACQERLDRLTADADSARWRRQQSGRPPEVRDSDPLLWRRVAALGAVLLDSSVPAVAGDTPPAEGHGPAAAPSLPVVPGYEILGELGRGGMAVVYRARQLSLGRIVALKMILSGPQAALKERSILCAEARAIAALQHPNIVQIYEGGEHDGRLYLSLEYLDGGSLARRLAGAPQPPRSAAALAATLARAVHFAHERGVVHRDLKPANILLASVPDDASLRLAPAGDATGHSTLAQRERALNVNTQCTPKIADFGLAKRLDAGATLFTSAAIVGTPSYVAPEQVREKAGAVGPAADIYALGAILYECLTGRPPFHGESTYDTLLQVVHQEPVAPRQLQPTVPRDLETVCLKCLHKDPRRRYGSALALAEDLERFLAGRPVRARPVGPLTRLAKWMRRRPGIAAPLVLVALLTVAGFVMLAWLWDHAEARAAAEAAAKDEAGKREDQERQARTAVEQLTAGIAFDRASALCERGETDLGLRDFAEGLAMAARGGDQELERVFRHNLAAWPSRLLRERGRLQHKSLVWAVAYSPRGDLVATASQDATVQLWDAATGKRHGAPLVHNQRVRCVAFSPDGRTLLTGTHEDAKGNTITHWDIATGKPLRRWGSRSNVRQLAFSPDGKLFVSLAPPEARLFDVSLDESVCDLHADEVVLAVAFSPDGKTVVSGGSRGVPRRWATTGRPLKAVALPYARPQGPIVRIAVSPDGKRVAAASVAGSKPAPDRPNPGLHGEVRVWDLATGAPHGPPLHDNGEIGALAFSPDSRLLAVGNTLLEWLADQKTFERVRGQVRIYEVATARRVGQPLQHRLGVMDLAFSPDSRLLLTGAVDGCARLFSVGCGELIGAPLQHEGSVMSVAFSPDGRTAVTGSAGGDEFHGAAGRLWELPQAAAPLHTLPFASRYPVLAVRGSHELLVTRRVKNQPTTLARFAVPDGRQSNSALKLPDGVNHITFSPDGKTMVICGHDRVLRFCDAGSGQERRQMRLDATPRSAAFSPDGALLLLGCERDTVNTLRLLDVASGAVRLNHPLQGAAHAVAFTPTGEALWITDDPQRCHLWCWTAATGPRQLWEKPAVLHNACFTGDVRASLLAYVDGSLQVVETRTGQALGATLPAHSASLAAVAIAEDARTVLLGKPDGTARLWDMTTGRPLGPPLHHYDAVRGVAFVPGGCYFATADASGTYLWTTPVRRTADRQPTTRRRSRSEDETTALDR